MKKKKKKKPNKVKDLFRLLDVLEKTNENKMKKRPRKVIQNHQRKEKLRTHLYHRRRRRKRRSLMVRNTLSLHLQQGIALM